MKHYSISEVGNFFGDSRICATYIEFDAESNNIALEKFKEYIKDGHSHNVNLVLTVGIWNNNIIAKNR